MPIRIQCPGCRKTLGVKDHLAGKKVQCPICKTPVRVPGSTSGQGTLPVAGPLPVKPSSRPMPPAMPSSFGIPTRKSSDFPVAAPADLEAMAAAALSGEIPAVGPETLDPGAIPPGGSNGEHGNGANGNGASPLAASAEKPPITFSCLFCDAELRLPHDMGGKQAPCPECSRIVKVPMPKEEKPKDWRTIQATGPSLARSNQPEKLADAWGTETKKTVSTTSLAQAGVLPPPPKKKIRLEDVITRAVKSVVALGLVVGAGWILWSLHQNRGKARENEGWERKFVAGGFEKKWSPVLRGEYWRAVGERYLAQPKQRDAAWEAFIKARDHAQTRDKGDVVNADLFYIQLAHSQLGLGGDEMAVRAKDRYEWTQEVPVELDYTFRKMDSDDAKAIGLREIAQRLIELKQPAIAIGLVNMMATRTDKARPLQIAMAPPSRKGDGKDVDFGKGVNELQARAETLASQGKVAEARKAIETTAKVTPQMKLEAVAALASYLTCQPGGFQSQDIKDTIALGRAVVEKEFKSRPAPEWPMLQLVRVTVRVDGEDAKPFIRFPSEMFLKRAKLEQVLGQLEKTPTPPNAVALIQELDPPSRALAWLALARHCGRTNQPFHFDPESAELEECRPLMEVSNISGPLVAK